MRKLPGRPRDPSSNSPRRVTIPEDQEKSAEEIQKFFAFASTHDAYRYGFEVYATQIFPKVKQLLLKGLDLEQAQLVVSKEFAAPQSSPQAQLTPQPIATPQSFPSLSAEAPAPSQKSRLFGSLKNR